MQKTILITTGCLFLILSGLFYFQCLSLNRLRLKNDTLRTEIENLKTGSSQSHDAQTDDAQPRNELPRLRGEIARLHQLLEEAEAMISSLTNSPVETTDSSAENFLINAHTNLAWGQTLIVGGWKRAAEKRSYVLLQATNGNEGQSFGLHARFYEIPEQVIKQDGMEALNTDTNKNSIKAVISLTATDHIVGTLTRAGLKPNGIANYSQKHYDPVRYERRDAWGGNQVLLTMTTRSYQKEGTRWISSSDPVLVVIPIVSPDRQSLQLTVSGLLNYPRNPTNE